MEAYPFVDEISLTLSSYWKTKPEERNQLKGLDIIERIRDLVEKAFKATPEDADILNKFIAAPEDRLLQAIFADRLKLILFRDPELAGQLDQLAHAYREVTWEPTSYNVNIEWGDASVSGSTAQVKQDRKVEVDSIDLSKYLDQ